MAKRTVVSRDQTRDAIARLGDAMDSDGDLPYTVELWTLPRSEVEKVLGRAASASLAQAIFSAAQVEHLGRRITLRQGDLVLSDSG